VSKRSIPIVLILVWLFLPYAMAYWWIVKHVAATTTDHGRQIAYVLSVVLCAVTLVTFGWAVGRGKWGVLIDDNNRVSLSKFQAAVWMCFVFPAVLVAVAWNTLQPRVGDSPDFLKAFDIGIPSGLLIALGISATSLVAAGFIKQDKANQVQGLDNSGPPVDSGEWTYLGNIAVHPSFKNAGSSDLYLAETVNLPAGQNRTAPPPDYNRMQQLYLTFITAGGYAFILFRWLHGAGSLSNLPAVSDTVAGLIMLSHGAYLVGKATAKATP